MPTPAIQLKKREDRRIRLGHPWVYSNEINTAITPLKQFSPGDCVLVKSQDGTSLGMAYINPHSLIAARLFSNQPEAALNFSFIREKIEIALRLRSLLFKKPYYRLIFGEADGLPGLVIDRFGEHFVMQSNTAGMEVRNEIIASAICHLFPETASILLRNDSPIREQEELTLYTKPIMGSPPETVFIEENGIPFSIPLLSGQKTGWFYDHRLNRARLKEYVADARVLDVFSYLGGFGIQAAVFGAKTVDCIEISTSAADFILKNAALNHVEHQVTVQIQDAFDAMKALKCEKRRYEVIILDPPAFVKKSKDHQEGLLAYQRLNELAFSLLSEDGILISCSCSMQVSATDLLGAIKRAAHRAQVNIQLIERGHQGPDHPIHLAIPETDYLKAFVVRKMGG